MPNQDAKIGCLIMAAGNAARYQSNKLAALLDGKPLFIHAFDAVPKDVFSVVTVVTRFSQIEDAAVRRGFSVVRNERPDLGLSRTVRLGTEAMADCDAILYMVSDQPLLADDSVRRIVDTWRAHTDCIVGAAHNGKRGNPCIFPREFFPALAALSGDRGGNALIAAHPDRLLTVEVARRELSDVDTPDALEALRGTSQGLEPSRENRTEL